MAANVTDGNIKVPEPQNNKNMDPSDGVRISNKLLSDFSIQSYSDITSQDTSNRSTYSSKHTKSIEKKSVTNAPVLLICVGCASQEIKCLAKINVNITVLPLIGSQLSKFIIDNVKTLDKDIWVIPPLSGLEEKDVDEKLLDVMRLRDEAERDASLPKSSFSVSFLVLGTSPSDAMSNHRDVIRRYPHFPRTHITIMSKTDPNEIAQFLCEHAKSRVAKVEHILKAVDPVTTFLVTIVMTLNHQDEGYSVRASKALFEYFDDPTSQVRQQWHLLFSMPNVRVTNVNTASDNGLMLELRPLLAEKLNLFIEACQDGTMVALILEHLWVDRTHLAGTVDVRLGDRVAEVKTVLSEQEHVDAESLHGNVPNPRTNTMRLSTTILASMYEDFLKDSTQTPYKLQQLLTDNASIQLLRQLHRNGYTAMHLAILHQRFDFLEFLLYQNEWGYLRQKPVESTDPTANHIGFIPRRLAESLLHKSRGYETLSRYETLDSIWMNMSVLNRAVLSRQLSLVKILLSSQPDRLREVDEVSGSNNLMYACGAGDYTIVKYLLEKGAQIHLHNMNNESCIHIAAKFGQTKVLEELSKHTLDICGQKNKEGYTALDICALNGDMVSLQVFHRNKFPMSGRSLGVAIRFKQYDVVKFLASECSVDVNSGADKLGRLPIHNAVLKGDIKAMRILFDHYADLKQTDKFHKTVCHMAAEGTRADVMELLIQTLKDTDALMAKELINAKDAFTGKDLLYVVRGKDHGRRAWHWIQLTRVYIHSFITALGGGEIDVAKHGRVLYSGFGPGSDKETNAKIEEKQNEALRPENRAWDMTPLHIAANKKHVDIARLLVDNGADCDATDHFGNTPAHLAAMRGSLELMRLFQEKGANLVALNDDQKTPLDVAQANGHPEIINCLQSRTVIARAKIFMEQTVNSLRERLDVETMTTRQNLGEDLKLYLIDALRDLSIDINKTLQDIGSGPVSEASQQN